MSGRSTVRIRVRPGLVALSFAAASGILMLTGLGMYQLRTGPLPPYLGHFSRRFLPWEEVTFHTWLSSAGLLLSAVILMLIGIAAYRERKAYARHWIALAFVFLILSVDEVAALHEITANFVRIVMDPQGFLSYPWVVVGLIVSGLLGIAFLRFIVRLPTKTRALVVLAGLTYLGGALGMEMVAANYESLHGAENFGYFMISSTEELMEMLGVAVFLYALLDYARSHFGRIEVELD